MCTAFTSNTSLSKWVTLSCFNFLNWALFIFLCCQNKQEDVVVNLIKRLFSVMKWCQQQLLCSFRWLCALTCRTFRKHLWSVQSADKDQAIRNKIKAKLCLPDQWLIFKYYHDIYYFSLSLLLYFIRIFCWCFHVILVGKENWYVWGKRALSATLI